MLHCLSTKKFATDSVGHVASIPKIRNRNDPETTPKRYWADYGQSEMEGVGRVKSAALSDDKIGNEKIRFLTIVDA